MTLLAESKVELHLVYGRFLASAGRHSNALVHLKKCADHPNPKCRQEALYNLSLSLYKLKRYSEAELYAREFLTETRDPDLLSNLASILVAQRKFSEAADLCLEALDRSENACIAAGMNLFTALRADNRLDEAIERTWRLLNTEPVSVLVDSSHEIPDSCVVCCVKWGTKYSADYVNRLFSSVQRNWKPGNFPRFICFTDNAEGVEDRWEVRKLPEIDFKFFWGKAFVFSEEAGLDGNRVIFLDLDTVILGDVSCYLKFPGDTLGVLSAQGLYNEQGLKSAEAVNTSLMVWSACPSFRPIFEAATEYIKKRVHRFDHWTEMVAGRCTLGAQKLWPGSIVDYNIWKSQGSSLSQESILLVFPGDTKPHHVLPDCQVVRDAWL